MKVRLRFRRYRNCNTAFRASAARKFELSIPPRWAVRFFCTRLESRVNKRPSRRRRQTDTSQFCVLPNSFEPHFCVPCGQPSLGRPAPPGLSTWPCRPSAPCPPLFPLVAPLPHPPDLPCPCFIPDHTPPSSGVLVLVCVILPQPHPQCRPPPPPPGVLWPWNCGPQAAAVSFFIATFANTNTRYQSHWKPL